MAVQGSCPCKPLHPFKKGDLLEDPVIPRTPKRGVAQKSGRTSRNIIPVFLSRVFTRTVLKNDVYWSLDNLTVQIIFEVSKGHLPSKVVEVDLVMLCTVKITTVGVETGVRVLGDGQIGRPLRNPRV